MAKRSLSSAVNSRGLRSRARGKGSVGHKRAPPSQEVVLILPGKSHGFADFQPYFTERMWEYFAEYLLDDRSTGADLYDRRDKVR